MALRPLQSHAVVGGRHTAAHGHIGHQRLLWLLQLLQGGAIQLLLLSSGGAAAWLLAVNGGRRDSSCHRAATADRAQSMF